MPEIIRCANCGTQVKTRKGLCRTCGYNLGEKLEEQAGFQVVLLKAGVDVRKLIAHLASKLHLSETEIKEFIENLPVIIFETNNRQVALGWETDLKVLGCKTEIISGIATSGEEMVEKKNSNSNLWSRILVFSFVILAFILSPSFKETKDRILKMLTDKNYINFINPGEKNFEIVEIIVAKTQILKGEYFSFENLKKKSIKRADAPVNAWPSLFIDKLVGMRAGKTYFREDIVEESISKSMADNE